MQMLKLVSQWWAAELKSALPWIENVLIDPQPRALILNGRDATTVVMKDVDAYKLRKEVFEVPLDQFSAEQTAQLRALCAKRELSLSVAAQEVLCLQLQVPRGAASNLRKSIAYRLLTDSPINPDYIVFDMRRTNIESDSDAIAVEVALCRRESLEKLKSCGEKLGFAAPHIGLAGNGGVELAFVFERARGVKTDSSRLRRNMLLALGPVLIFMFTLSVTWAYANWNEKGLRMEIAALSSRTTESVRLLSRQAHARGISQAINNDLPKTAISQILNDVSKTLPQSAWLSEIRIEGNKLRLIGNGTDPTSVAKALAATPNLTAVRLDSVTAGNAGYGAEGVSRFEIDAEIAPGRIN